IVTSIKIKKTGRNIRIININIKGGKDLLAALLLIGRLWHFYQTYSLPTFIAIHYATHSLNTDTKVWVAKEINIRTIVFLL
ncbi:MAG: hypothetical protein ACSLE0_08250, partial [Chitinophagaceae bacterium]